MSKKVTAYGGYNAKEFDDGVYDGVSKVIVAEDRHGVAYIKISYKKNGGDVEKEHGRYTGAQVTETPFAVKWPDEYITSIWGTHRKDDDRIKNSGGSTSKQPNPAADFKMYESDPALKGLHILADNEPSQLHLLNDHLAHIQDVNSPVHKNTVSELQFKTSYGRTSPKFGKPGPGSSDFVLEGKNGTKLVGLHGRSGEFLDAIGAYFAVVPSAFKHLEPLGGPGGVSWDDGDYDYLRKVFVGEDGDRVSSVEFHYMKGTNVITHRHGKDSKYRREFVIHFTHGEYLTSVEGTIHTDGFISSLTFTTSEDRRSPEFGKPLGTKFLLHAKGFDHIVGFRGRSCLDRIYALGAHFAVVVSPPVKKLEAKGGVFGDDWDDGVHDNVRMVTVRYDHRSVKSVKFEYMNGPVIGDAHGDIHKDDKKKELKLYFNNEYITSVEGHYGQKLPPNESRKSSSALGPTYMTMLKFKTNLTEYQVLKHSPDYTYVGTSFKFEETNHMIVGFHGKTEVSLNQIGVYVKPIHNA